jgi:hypothetical protein
MTRNLSFDAFLSLLRKDFFNRSYQSNLLKITTTAAGGAAAAATIIIIIIIIIMSSAAVMPGTHVLEELFFSHPASIFSKTNKNLQLQWLAPPIHKQVVGIIAMRKTQPFSSIKKDTQCNFLLFPSQVSTISARKRSRNGGEKARGRRRSWMPNSGGESKAAKRTDFKTRRLLGKADYEIDA